MRYLILLVLLTGCASTEMVVEPDGGVKWKSWTFAKDVKDAHVIWGGFEATLGSSVGNAEVIAATGRALQCEIDFTNYVEANR
jgi:hypothetical protein